MPEIIKNNENGLIISPKNPDLLAKTINGFLANKNIAKEMAITAKNQVIKKFNLSRMIQNTENAYKDVSSIEII